MRSTTTTTRFTLAFRLGLALVGIATLSITIALVLQERALSTDLMHSAQHRLGSSSRAAARLVETHLRTVTDRFQAVSGTPQFRATLEVNDGPTLAFFAEGLRAREEALQIIFFDDENQPVATAGEFLPEARVGAAGPAEILIEGGTLVAVVSVELQTSGRRVGRLVAVEEIQAGLFEEWSALCGARVVIDAGPQNRAPPEETLVRELQAYPMRVEMSLAAENMAIANSRKSLYAAALTALVAAFAVSVFLSRTLAAPIREIKNVAERIGGGELSSRVLSSRRDEIGQLAMAVNDMALRLSQHRDYLVQANRELMTVNTRLRDAKDRSEEANQAKNEFLANISHELRTPMHAILSYSKFGRSKWESAERKNLLEFFEKIGLSGVRLLRLIDNLLDLSKLEAGKTQPRFECADLRNVVDVALSEMGGLLEERQLSVQVEDELQSSPRVDRDRIAQVFRNILGNAIKFSPVKGSILVRLEEEDGWVAVSVADEGPGIQDDETELIFDKFVQASRTKTGAGGTGLGLAISREIVEAHGGTISVGQSPLKGACLAFRIPVNQPGQPSAADPRATPQPVGVGERA